MQVQTSARILVPDDPTVESIMKQYLQDPVSRHERKHGHAGTALTVPSGGKPEKIKTTVSTTSCADLPVVREFRQQGAFTPP